MIERHLADRLQVAVAGQVEPGVPHHRLHHHGGDFGPVLFETCGKCVLIVPLDHDHVENAVGHAGRTGDRRAESLGRQIGQRSVITVEDRLAPTVVVSLEHHQLAAAGERPRQTDGRGAGLGAGIGESQQLHAGKELLELFGHADRDFRGEAQLAAAVGDLPRHGFDHLRRPMAEQQRSVRHVEVDVLVAVDIPQPRAFAPVGDERNVVGQHAHRAAVAAGDTAAPPLQHASGLGGGGGAVGGAVRMNTCGINCVHVTPHGNFAIERVFTSSLELPGPETAAPARRGGPNCR